MKTKPTRTAHPPLDVVLDIAPVPAPDSANALTVIAAQAGTVFEVQEAPVVEDFDLADYDWVPVRRKARRDGWTVAAQESFIGVLADTGSVTQAAIEVNMSATSCYRLRRSADGRAFAAAWDAAVQTASLRLVDLAFDRAVNGSPEPVFDREGRRVGQRIRYNDRLLMFLLRAHQPDRYRTPGQGASVPVMPALSAPPIETALAALAPPLPPEPHLLMAPDDLAIALQVADIRSEPATHLPHPAADTSPLGAAFEAQLAAAKATIPDRRRFDDTVDDDDADAFQV
ncbi:hypothetical protein [Sphingomonas faeni]|uniref:hypothetical protein n=1 Tax=Sphingomonas faeni TaxID=185950 RepID=UPI003363FC0B